MPAQYGLERGRIASMRLNLQHFLWKQQLGYNLHPSIPTDKAGLKIADVATGTGVWVFEIASSLPQAQVDGFDISLDQLPPQDHLPENIKFDLLNILEDVPQHLQGRYDIVHCRMMSLVLTTGDPMPMFRNLLSMLKPGGWIQFGEAEHLRMYQQRRERNPSPPGWELYEPMYQMMEKAYPQEWAAALDAHLTRAGAQNVHFHRYPISASATPFAHKAWSDQQLLAFDEMAEALVPAAGGDSGEIKRLVRKVAQEWRGGAEVYYCPVVGVGRRGVF